jgi:hypothetical protein
VVLRFEFRSYCLPGRCSMLQRASVPHLFFFWDRVLLCCLGWPWTCPSYGTSNSRLYWEDPPEGECWDYRWKPPCLAISKLFSRHGYNKDIHN